jgi:ATP adenylyltransferase
MKRLFSPWRSAYIETFKSPKKDEGCLFCSIAKERDDGENLVAARFEMCYVVMNKFPYNNGHVMIVPYRHSAKFSELQADERLEIMDVAAHCMDALQNLMTPQGFNFGANIGRDAGAGIDRHIHFHIVPRWSGDTNFMPVLSDVKLISEDTSKICEALRKYFTSTMLKRMKQKTRKKSGTKK